MIILQGLWDLYATALLKCINPLYAAALTGELPVFLLVTAFHAECFLINRECGVTQK
jgi:hypothetical protein